MYIVSFCGGRARGVRNGPRGRGAGGKRYLLGWLIAAVVFAILGASGGLTNLAAGVAAPERADAVLDNSRDLAFGAIRSFAFVAIAVG